MKKTLYTALCSIFIGLSCLAGTGPNSNAVSSAERNLKIHSLLDKEIASFLEVIPVGFEKQHGFNDRSEFAKATLGHIYSIVGMDANWNTFSTGMYNIPVIVNGEYRAMVTVSEKNGTYELETVGAAQLAKELQNIESSVSGIQDYIMLNVYSKASGFVAYPKSNMALDACSFIPLESAQSALSESSTRSVQTSYTLSELVEGLKTSTH